MAFRFNIERDIPCAYAPYNWEEDIPSDTNVALSNHEGFYAEGYDIQIAKLVAAQMGRELEIVKLPWDGLLEGLNQGQVDGIVIKRTVKVAIFQSMIGK